MIATAQLPFQVSHLDEKQDERPCRGMKLRRSENMETWAGYSCGVKISFIDFKLINSSDFPHTTVLLNFDNDAVEKAYLSSKNVRRTPIAP